MEIVMMLLPIVATFVEFDQMTVMEIVGRCLTQAAIIVGACATIAAVTPTQKDDEFFGKVMVMINLMGANFANAKNKKE